MDPEDRRAATLDDGSAHNRLDAVRTGRSQRPVDLVAAIDAIDTFTLEVTAAVRDLGDELIRHETAIEARLDDVLRVLTAEPPATATRGGALSALRRLFEHEAGDRAATAGGVAADPPGDHATGAGDGRVRGGQGWPTAMPRAALPSAPGGGSARGHHCIVAFCLQPFRIYVDDMPVASWRGNLSQELLRLLLTRHPAPVTRDELLDVFWPDADPEAARRCLHQMVYRLRGTLRPVAGERAIICYRSGSYSISDDVDVWTDADEFERLVAEGHRCERRGDLATAVVRLSTAETLYYDGYMQDRPYDDWCRERRDALHRTYVDVVAHLADLHAAQGDHAAAILLSQRLIMHEPTHEAAYRRMMRGYIAQGHRHLAAAAYRQCEAVLSGELGMAPSAATISLFAQIGATR